MTRYRYGAWHGGPDPLAPPADVADAVDRLGQDVLAGGGVRDALRELLRRGGHPGHGLDHLLERVRRRRAHLRRRGALDGTLRQVRELLDRAVDAELVTLAGDASDDATLRAAQLDSLPADTARAVRELEPYEWRSAAGRDAYDAIRELLRREVLDHQFRGLREALGGDTEAAQRTKEMLVDLNELLSAHAGGEDTSDRFARFLRRHGELFPERPRDVDELVDTLAQRAAAAERMVRSLTRQQRDELAGLADDALRDNGLATEMAALRDNLRALRPSLDWQSAARMSGERPLPYGEAAGVLEELADLDALAEQLEQEHPGATLDDVDVEALERRLGSGAVADLRGLQELERQGWLARDRGGLHLTPKALRRLGQTALTAVFARLEARGAGGHDLPDAGAAGDPTGSWREWRFGDEQPLDAVRTVGNAVLRTAAQPRQPYASGLRLAVDDFVVAETERRTTAAVALLVDLSLSMVQEDRWAPMKQTALALHHLVATRFRQDALEIVGFNRWARRLSVGQLAAVEPDRLQGTNLHHALLVAGRFLRRHPDAEPVVLVVTDGEPTAHLDDAGEACFDWPPTYETLRRTVAEIDGLTRYGATINTFMLGEDPGLRRFVDAIARRNGGRVLSASSERLGEYVVDDYLRVRRGRAGHRR